MICHEPAHGLNIGVPGVPCGIAMAIIAGGPKQRTYFRLWLKRFFKHLSTRYSRNISFRSVKLYGNK
uniref:Uncharacterized protein n=1 Tax=Elizabethkingia anophelis TaxID=1117645 RepID=A0A455ZGU7_9FLAO|nr:TPA_exp: hypothetical protein [Elizabethkingia anophelis]DAC75984.1 TPA_exp: hypothetical protein [Elizabethkingia anophelis]DAC76531.1 TPA_exp: hypothetical protein [Elizabethkingia anophelis]